MELKNKLSNLKKNFEEEINKISSLKELEDIRVKFLGKNGYISNILKEIKNLPLSDKIKISDYANKIKEEVQEILNKRKEEELKLEIERQLEKEKIDVTLPGRRVDLGTLHPLTKIFNEVKSIFIKMGFDLIDGPEIETTYRNFDALSISPNHPARAKSDTFYIDENNVLRTHTTNVQIRELEKKENAKMLISIGKVYRPDYDLTHTPMFHQLEGLALGQDINFSKLKGTLKLFLEELFEKDIKIRFRPHFFPYTEPSAEVDISCIFCNAKGCRVCKHSGWIEILGSGMVSPIILKNLGYNPEEISGFAFGVGLERISMLKYGINDIRLFFENDLSFLKQFSVFYERN